TGQDSMLLKLLRRTDLQDLLQTERQKADLKRKESKEIKQSPPTNEAYASQAAQAAQFPFMMQQSAMALGHPSFMLGSTSFDFYRENIARQLLEKVPVFSPGMFFDDWIRDVVTKIPGNWPVEAKIAKKQN